MKLWHILIIIFLGIFIITFAIIGYIFMSVNNIKCPNGLQTCGNSCIPTNAECCDTNNYCLKPAGNCKDLGNNCYNCKTGQKFCGMFCIPSEKACCIGSSCQELVKSNPINLTTKIEPVKPIEPVETIAKVETKVSILSAQCTAALTKDRLKSYLMTASGTASGEIGTHFGITNDVNPGIKLNDCGSWTYRQSQQDCYRNKDNPEKTKWAGSDSVLLPTVSEPINLIPEINLGTSNHVQGTAKEVICPK